MPLAGSGSTANLKDQNVFFWSIRPPPGGTCFLKQSVLSEKLLWSSYEYLCMCVYLYSKLKRKHWSKMLFINLDLTLAIGQYLETF